MNVRQEVQRSIVNGEPPADDGWGWLYAAVEVIAPRRTRRRRLLCAWFRTSPLEAAHGSMLYRVLGVHRFGRLIPTGGVDIRRATGARMKPYTLRGISIGAARDFYYRACVFEALHLPFFLTLVALAVHRLSIGRLDLALEDTVINAVVNLYPMLHHRHTRSRIVRLLQRSAVMSR